MNGRWVLAIVGGLWIVAAIALLFVGTTMVAQSTVDDVLEGFDIAEDVETSSGNATAGALLIWVSYILIILGVVILIIGLVMAYGDRDQR
jgi:TRAP-type C4-dicarboxylate transport system permease small subunit